jgi:hypothetical protein
MSTPRHVTPRQVETPRLPPGVLQHPWQSCCTCHDTGGGSRGSIISARASVAKGPQELDVPTAQNGHQTAKSSQIEGFHATLELLHREGEAITPNFLMLNKAKTTTRAKTGFATPADAHDVPWNQGLPRLSGAPQLSAEYRSPTRFPDTDIESALHFWDNRQSPTKAATPEQRPASRTTSSTDSRPIFATARERPSPPSSLPRHNSKSDRIPGQMEVNMHPQQGPREDVERDADGGDPDEGAVQKQAHEADDFVPLSREAGPQSLAHGPIFASQQHSGASHRSVDMSNMDVPVMQQKAVSSLGLHASRGDRRDSFVVELPPPDTTTKASTSLFPRSDVAATSNIGARSVYPPHLMPQPVTPNVAYSVHHHLSANENLRLYGNLTGSTSGGYSDGVQKASLFIM